MRKLASVQIISKILPHLNADTLEIAEVLGWKVVVKKGIHKEGDKVVFFEPDSFFPVDERYEFLRKDGFRNHPLLGDGFRLKVTKLRGEISMGLIMPIDLFDQEGLKLKVEGEDVSNILNIRKYENIIRDVNGSNIFGNTIGNFPIFVKKTDQERIQSFYKDFIKKYSIEEFESIFWEITEKCDGSSITIGYNETPFNEEKIFVCSRNYKKTLIDEKGSFIRTAKQNNYLDALEKYAKSIALQGELCGEGIQSNKYKINGYKIFIFDIWLINEKRYALYNERSMIIQDLCNLGANIQTVPFIDIVKLPNDVKKIVDMSIGRSLLNTKINREGLVFKSTKLIENEVISFKSISPEFLLRYNDDEYILE